MLTTKIFSCGSSPAGAENVVTVGASTIDDAMAWFSNHGPCVDVFAPGANVSCLFLKGAICESEVSPSD